MRTQGVVKKQLQNMSNPALYKIVLNNNSVGHYSRPTTQPPLSSARWQEPAGAACWCRPFRSGLARVVVFSVMLIVFAPGCRVKGPKEGRPKLIAKLIPAARVPLFRAVVLCCASGLRAAMASASPITPCAERTEPLIGSHAQPTTDPFPLCISRSV